MSDCLIGLRVILILIFKYKYRMTQTHRWVAHKVCTNKRVTTSMI